MPVAERVTICQQLSDVRRRAGQQRKSTAPFVFRCLRFHADDATECVGPELARLADNSTAVKACPKCGQTYLLQTENGIPSMLGLPAEETPGRA